MSAKMLLYWGLTQSMRSQAPAYEFKSFPGFWHANAPLTLHPGAHFTEQASTRERNILLRVFANGLE